MGGSNPRDPYWEDLKIVILGIGTVSFGLLIAGHLLTLDAIFGLIAAIAGLAIIIFGVSEMIRDWRNPPEELDDALAAEDEAGSSGGQKTRTIVVVKVRCRRCGTLNHPDITLCTECGAQL